MTAMKCIEFFKSSYNFNFKIEESYVIAFKDSGEMKIKQLDIGTQYSVTIDYRKIVSFLKEEKSTKCVVIHTHPNDSWAFASSQDNRVTWVLVQKLMEEGIELVDHLILASANYFSYFVSGALEKYKSISYSKEKSYLFAENIFPLWPDKKNGRLSYKRKSG